MQKKREARAKLLFYESNALSLFFCRFRCRRRRRSLFNKAPYYFLITQHLPQKVNWCRMLLKLSRDLKISLVTSSF